MRGKEIFHSFVFWHDASLLSDLFLVICGIPCTAWCYRRIYFQPPLLTCLWGISTMGSSSRTLKGARRQEAGPFLLPKPLSASAVSTAATSSVVPAFARQTLSQWPQILQDSSPHHGCKFWDQVTYLLSVDSSLPILLTSGQPHCPWKPSHVYM